MTRVQCAHNPTPHNLTISQSVDSDDGISQLSDTLGVAATGIRRADRSRSRDRGAGFGLVPRGVPPTTQPRVAHYRGRADDSGSDSRSGEAEGDSTGSESRSTETGGADTRGGTPRTPRDHHAPQRDRQACLGGGGLDRPGSAAPTAHRSRHYVFTINNHTPAHRLALSALGAVYLCYQPEIGEEGRTPHLQGVISFSSARAFTAIAKLVPGWHIDRMRGTIQQAVDYCSKEETRDTTASFGFVEEGTRPLCAGSAGGRSDLAAVVLAIKAKMPLRDICDQFTEQYIHYNRGIERAIGLLGSNRQHKTEVYWYHGSTGSGKTRAASDACPGAYWKNPVNKWWDGYQAHEDVIIDDYRCDFSTFTTLLRLFDRYPMQVEAKGTSVEFVAKRIFVTCPQSYTEMWSGQTDEKLAQLTRRITECKHFAILNEHDTT
jgi:hypothetical protein